MMSEYWTPDLSTGKVPYKVFLYYNVLFSRIILHLSTYVRTYFFKNTVMTVSFDFLGKKNKK